MNTYIVRWEVSKYAKVEATSEAEAIEQVLNGSVPCEEDEITMAPTAYRRVPITNN